MHADLNIRHGSILGTSEVIKALHSLNFEIDSQRQQVCIKIISSNIKEILNIVPAIEKARLYRGKGGEMIRYVVCMLIEAIAIAKIPLQSVKVQSSLAPDA